MQTIELNGNLWRFYLPEEEAPKSVGFHRLEYDYRKPEQFPEGYRSSGAQAILIVGPDSRFEMETDLLSDYRKALGSAQRILADAPPEKWSEIQSVIDTYEQWIDEEVDRRLGL